MVANHLLTAPENPQQMGLFRGH